MKEERIETFKDEEVIQKESNDKELLEAYYKNIGEKIKKAREETGYTLGRLASGLGLTPSAIANYESGIRQIPVHVLLELARTLGKPFQYFLGLEIETPLLLSQSLKNVVERFTDATYIEVLYEIKNGIINHIEGHIPLIPVAPEIAKDSHFAVRTSSFDTYSYYICKWYKPNPKKVGIPFFSRTTEEFISPKPDDWVIAAKDFDPVGFLEKNNPLEKWELIQYKNVPPSPEWKEKACTINVRAVVIARIERLVK